jgi:hypothetical protein
MTTTMHTITSGATLGVEAWPRRAARHYVQSPRARGSYRLASAAPAVSAASVAPAAPLARDARRDAAYRRLAIAILGLDVETLAASLVSSTAY